MAAQGESGSGKIVLDSRASMLSRLPIHNEMRLIKVWPERDCTKDGAALDPIIHTIP